MNVMKETDVADRLKEFMKIETRVAVWRTIGS